MEPGFLKPGNRFPDRVEDFQEQVTSMEPGFLKPGNVATVDDEFLERVTSMEPGFLKPGNRMRAGRSSAITRYFNGAGLPEARKLAIFVERPNLQNQTSMEPGFLKPGNTIKDLSSDVRINLLQWSRAS